MLLPDLLTYIDAQSTAFKKFAGTTGNLGISLLLDGPNVPNTITAIYETQGLPAAKAFSTSARAQVVYEQPRFQIIARSTKYSTARTNIETIYTLLDGIQATLPTSTGTYYQSIDALQAPFSLGRDEEERWLIACNFQAQKAVG